MNIYFRCLESRIDKNNTLYGKFNLASIPSGQGNTFANALRRSLFSDLSGLAITHFCITSSPSLGYEFATIPGLAESLLDFSLNLKRVVLTGRLTGALSTCYKQQVANEGTSFSSPKSTPSPFYPFTTLPLPLCSSLPLSYPQKDVGVQKTITPIPPHLSGGKKGVIAKGKRDMHGYRRGILPSVSCAYPQKDMGVSMQGMRSKARKLKVKKGDLLFLWDAQQRKGYTQPKEIRYSPFESKISGTKANLKKGGLPELKINHEGLPLNSDLRQKKNKKYNVQNFPPLAPIGFLKAQGPAVLRARDLILPPGIRCVHPDQYLGTLAADSTLSIKFLIAAGKGYIVQDETFYKSLSRAKLLLSFRNSKNSTFSTSATAGTTATAATAFFTPLGYSLHRYPQKNMGVRTGDHPSLASASLLSSLSTPTVSKESLGKITPHVLEMSQRGKKAPLLLSLASLTPRSFSKIGGYAQSPLVMAKVRESNTVAAEYPSAFGDALKPKVRKSEAKYPFLCFAFQRKPKVRSPLFLPIPKETESKITQYFRQGRSPVPVPLSSKAITPSLLCIPSEIEDKTLSPKVTGHEYRGKRHRICEANKGVKGYRGFEKAHPFLLSTPTVSLEIKDVFIKSGCRIEDNTPLPSEIEDKTYLRFPSPLLRHKVAGHGYSKGILFQKSINQKQISPLLNDNEKLLRKQLIWGTEDKFHPVLPLDATFTPISKVNFQIDIDRNTEKSEETIVLEIWTNGSITPKRAIQESCLALAQDFYSLFSSVNGFSNLHSWWKRESLQFYPTHFS